MNFFSQNLKKSKFVSLVIASVLSAIAINLCSPATSSALLAQKAQVSLTFDDAYLSTLTQAAPTLAKYGLTGTEYAPTSCVASVRTCKADPGSTYLNWAQLASLKTTYGWEIGAHASDHTSISQLTDAQLVNQINASNQAFTSHGIPTPTAFASPQGDYSSASLGTIAKYYTSHRGFHDTGYNVYPYNDYILRVQQVQVGVSVAQVKSYIDTAKTNGQWLILVFHEIQSKPNADPRAYEYSTSDLDQIASYIKSSGISNTNVSNGLVTSQTNLMPNSSFASGFNSGWTTDDTTGITLNSTDEGSVSSATQSIKMIANSTKNTHLFSPKVAINSTDTYILKQYVKLMTRTSGDVSFYIDEYDINGNWIGGQYKGSQTWLFPEEKTFVYKPSSANVSKISLQIIVTKASGITAYLDNVQLFSSTGMAVTPPVISTNLVAGGTFDSGLSDGWTTDKPQNVVADSSNNGDPANQERSIKMTSTTTNIHLFSPKVQVVNTKTYNLSVFRKIASLLSGELGFYIDEYDSNGNWIGGQYKGSAYSAGSGTTNISYTPSSALVASASLQIFVTSNSGIVAYIDNVKWF